MPAAAYIDPQMRAIHHRMARSGLTEFYAWVNREPRELHESVEIEWPGPFGRTRARLHRPAPRGSAQAALVFLHGGGWVGGSMDLEDSSMRELAWAADCCVVSVDYVLAPRFRFPMPLEDCIAATRYIHEHAADWDLDADRVAIGGSSAGANLALAAACALRDSGERWLRFILLQYGFFCPNTDSEAHRRFGKGEFGQNSDALMQFVESYLEHPSQRSDPRVALLHADLRDLPATFLSAAQIDPLRDDSIRLAERLRAHGVDTTLKEYRGVTHGFSLMVRDLDAARLAIGDAAVALRSAMQ